MVTLAGLSPWTLDATRLAMPRTCAESRLPPPESSTAAVAGFSSSAKSLSSGRVSCTSTPVTPSTPPTVWAISPSSARW